MSAFRDMVPGTRRCRRTLGPLVALLLLAGCASLAAPDVEEPALHALEAQPAVKPAAARRNLVLAVDTPRARPGFDSPRIAYVQRPHELNYFVTSRWVATPARMLEPLLQQALEQTEGFRAVVSAGSAVPADVVLEVELVRLQHDFQVRPSQVQLALRAQLIDVRNRRVLAARQFDDAESAASDDAYGGVLAANRLVARAIERLAEFCVSASPAP